MIKKTVFLLLLLPFLWRNSYAQLCNGSLGDPVAWITFGTGSDIGPALPASITNYSFSNSTCPNDGSYTIVSQSAECFTGSWFTVNDDHTPGDVNGKFMLVNASNTPGVFYLDTIRGLCSGTTYEFSSYILNVLKPGSCSFNGIDPDLTFTIETLTGTVITTYNTGQIVETPTPEWRQYGTFFETPADVAAVVVRIKNNAPGGCGNDLALDDITFRPCGPRVETKLALDGSKEKTLCIGDERSFLLSGEYSNSYPDPRFQWQLSIDNGQNWANIPGATGISYMRTFTGEGVFNYRLLIANGGNINNPSCRVASESVKISVVPPPDVSLIKNLSACQGTEISLGATGGQSYQWTGPNGFTSNLVNPAIGNLQPINVGWYVVTASIFEGCSNKDSSYLTVLPSPSLQKSADAAICAGQSVQLNASGGIKYNWEPAAGLSDAAVANPTANPPATTRFTVTISDNNNCIDTGSILVKIFSLPVANAGPDLKTLKDRPVQLQGTVGGDDVSFQWSPALYINSVVAERPTVLPVANFYPQNFIYRLEVRSNQGCGSAADEVTVTVYEKIKIPNTFTPNGDGYNDNWEIDLLSNFPGTMVEVYNTQGQLIFKSTGYSKPWDGRYNGKLVPAGTYYYVIDLREPDTRKLSGYITVIR